MNRLSPLVVFLVACGSTTGPSVDATVITVTSLEVTPGTISMKRGLDAPPQLTAMATLSNGMTEDVTASAAWSSSATTIATADAGLVKPIASGDATITATFGGKSGSAMVTIKSPSLFVTDFGPTRAIDVFDAYSSGDSAPLRRITGATTTFAEPLGIAVYHDEIYVADFSAAAIDVFPVAATGDVAPTRRIVGATTTLAQPVGIAVVNDEIYVTSTSKILVFPSNGTGDIAPTRSITGATTGLAGSVYGLAVDHGEIYVTNFPSKISVFPATATGDVAPTRSIAGPTTLLVGAYAVAVNDGEMFVGNSTSITVFLTTQTGDTPPIRRITGPDTTIGGGAGAAAVLGHEVYLTFFAPMIAIFPRDSTSDTPPTRSVTGASTTLQTPFGATFY